MEKQRVLPPFSISSVQQCVAIFSLLSSRLFTILIKFTHIANAYRPFLPSAPTGCAASLAVRTWSSRTRSRCPACPRTLTWHLCWSWRSRGRSPGRPPTSATTAGRTARAASARNWRRSVSDIVASFDVMEAADVTRAHKQTARYLVGLETGCFGLVRRGLFIGIRRPLTGATEPHS